MRVAILGFIGVLGVGMVLWGGSWAPVVWAGEGPERTCEAFLSDPHEGPVRLRDCRLDFERSVVVSRNASVQTVWVALAAEGGPAAQPSVVLGLREPELAEALRSQNWDEIDTEAHQQSELEGYVFTWDPDDVELDEGAEAVRAVFGASGDGASYRLGTAPGVEMLLVTVIPGLLLVFFSWLNLFGPWSR